VFFDSHVHSAASPDSDMKAEKAVAAAKKPGLGVVFTEHVDFGALGEYVKYSDPHATDIVRGMGDFVCDFEMYPAEYRRLRGDNVLLGLEFGLTRAFAGLNAKIVAEGDYDFIIGSVHSVDGLELYKASNKHEDFMDTQYAKNLHDSRGVDDCIARYLEYSREMVEISTYFDSFGHIDYVARYAPLVGEKFMYDRFAAQFDAILKLLADREIALEINTSRFGAENGAERAMGEICGHFARLGGRYCTVGSDAHVVSKIGHCYDAARLVAAEAGLKIVHFRERKAILSE